MGPRGGISWLEIQVKSPVAASAAGLTRAARRAANVGGGGGHGVPERKVKLGTAHVSERLVIESEETQAGCKTEITPPPPIFIGLHRSVASHTHRHTQQFSQSHGLNIAVGLCYYHSGGWWWRGSVISHCFTAPGDDSATGGGGGALPQHDLLH